MKETVNESEARLIAPVAPKKFNGLIAFSLNKVQFEAARAFFSDSASCNALRLKHGIKAGNELQLDVKAFLLEAVNDNKVGGVEACGAAKVRLR
jgi:hypothetical protein